MDTKTLVQYPIGPSNSTSAETFNNLRPSEVYIAVKEISNKSDVILRDAPETQRILRRSRVQKPVSESLNRSIKDNAEIWSELSKY